MSRVVRETLRHQEAFDYYYTLGPERSYTEVARKFGVSRTAVAKWARAFDWQRRVQERDAENARRLHEKTDESVVATKARYRRVIGAAIAQWIKDFRSGAVEVGTVRNLERLIKLDLLLMGEPTERLEHGGTITDRHEYEITERIISDPEARQLARQLYERVRPDDGPDAGNR